MDFMYGCYVLKPSGSKQNTEARNDSSGSMQVFTATCEGSESFARRAFDIWERVYNHKGPDQNREL